MTSTRSAPSGSVWAPIRRTALAKVVVMGVAGVFGLINTRLIISHFGTDAYAQYGLLATFPNLMPFTDLGIGAVILNAVAGSSDLPHDAVVRRIGAQTLPEGAERVEVMGRSPHQKLVKSG